VWGCPVLVWVAPRVFVGWCGEGVGLGSVGVVGVGDGSGVGLVVGLDYC
jgi:hypothetical protein